MLLAISVSFCHSNGHDLPQRRLFHTGRAELRDAVTLEIGRHLQALRQERRYSARALAEMCQAKGLRIDRARLADIENGRRRPVSVEEWLQLASILDVAPFDLLVGPGAGYADLVDLGGDVITTVVALRQLMATPTAFDGRNRVAVEELLSLFLGGEDIVRVLKVLDAVAAMSSETVVLDLARSDELGATDGAR
jgi:transcriptional regulator with XRE-family HTH domain